MISCTHASYWGGSSTFHRARNNFACVPRRPILLRRFLAEADGGFWFTCKSQFLYFGHLLTTGPASIRKSPAGSFHICPILSLVRFRWKACQIDRPFLAMMASIIFLGMRIRGSTLGTHSSSELSSSLGGSLGPPGPPDPPETGEDSESGEEDAGMDGRSDLSEERESCQSAR
jgi:hypothetical protein